MTTRAGRRRVRYGSQRLAERLKHEGWKANAKRIYLTSTRCESDIDVDTYTRELRGAGAIPTGTGTIVTML